MKTFHNLKAKLLPLFLLGAGVTTTLLANPQSESQTTDAQTFCVRGVIMESRTGTGCPAAIYRIYSEKDSILPIISNVTDTLGRFNQPLDTAGNYRLVTEFIGTRPAERIFELSATTPIVNLDTIPISSDETTLGEVVISVRKPLVESDGSTLTYNMDVDDDAKSNNLLDMLRKVPMVSVDGDENIMVKGSKSFKILVNHKEDPMFSSGNLSTILKAMPASSIRKIEVITEPGAKYDAEGTAGILNIITVSKQNLEGIFGNLNAWINNNSIGASAYVRTKIKNVTASANVYYYNMGAFETPTESRNEVFNSESEEAAYQVQTSNTRHPWSGDNVNGQFNLSWEPDTTNLFTTQFSVGNYLSKSTFPAHWEVYNRRIDKIDDIYDIDNNYTFAWGTDVISKHKYNGLWLSGQLSYQHTFRENHYITLSYQYGYNDSYSNGISEYENGKNYPSEELYRKEQENSYYNRHVGQLDYALPIAGKHILEVGAKGTFMTNRAVNTPFRGLSAETAAPLTENYSNTQQFQNIVALYAAFTGKFSKFTGKAGVRYEYTDMGLRYKLKPESNFASRLHDIVPNASLSYNFTPGTNLRMGYQMRINRPGLWALNPYNTQTTILSESHGNPDLKSEKTHTVSLAYSNYGGKLGGSARVEYSYNGNEICDYIYTQDDKVITSYANIGKINQIGMNVNLSWNIIKDMNFNLYAYGYYKDIRANSPELKASRNGWGGNLNANWDYRIPIGIRFGAYGGVGAGYFDIQYKSPSYYYYGVSVSKGFLKDEALRLSINGSNMFNPYRDYKSDAVSESVRSISWTRRQQWSVSFSISWNFGGLKADVKQTNSDISGDDSGNSGGGKKN